MRVLLLAGVLFLGASFASWADMDSAKKAAAKGDYKTALQEFEILARRGDVEAQFNTGQFYLQGKGTAKDIVKAAQWLELAGDGGHSEALSSLGSLYLIGIGVPQNYRKAHDILHKAALAGDGSAQFNLATIFRLGLGTETDPVRAHAWALLAERNGVTEARRTRQLLGGVMTSDQVKVSNRLAETLTGDIERSLSATGRKLPSAVLPKIVPDNPLPSRPLPEVPAKLAMDAPSPPRPSVSEAALALSEEEPWSPQRGLHRSAYWVYLGAARSQALAEGEWLLLQRKYAPLLNDRQPSFDGMEVANLGHFVRISVGPFTSRKAPVKLCAEMAVNGDDCLVKRRR